ncbi:MAG: polymerase sigma factor FliA [Pseudomonadota bacterium]|jgi:RNA polymerase sigma factor FliA
MASALALYQQTHTEFSTEDLILQHMPMVKRVAIHLKARIPPFMELDELIQVGMVGLIEAARAFDPDKGYEFEHFALSRVRGSILDEVRRQSFLPRSAVAFNRSESEAVHVLGAELGRTPTQAELAQYMGKEIDEFQKERGQAKRFETFSIEVVSDEVMAMPADHTQQPEIMVEEAEFMQAVVSAIDLLPEREKLVMSLYYVEELNLKEIGEVLGVTESRVSQILSTVVKKLRQQLKVG